MEEPLVGVSTGIQGRGGGLRPEERQSVTSLTATEAGEEALCNSLLVWVSKQ